MWKRVIIVRQSPTGQESSSTASKTSDEKFKLTKTLFSIASTLSSKQTLSWLIRLLSDVGLMTIMRGTPWGALGSVDLCGVFPKFRESKESLLWPPSLPLMLPFSSLASEMSLVRLWLRLLVRTSRGRVATVRELETSSCSQVLNDSFMVDGFWRCKKKTNTNTNTQEQNNLQNMNAWKHAGKKSSDSNDSKHTWEKIAVSSIMIFFSYLMFSYLLCGVGFGGLLL